MLEVLVDLDLPHRVVDLQELQALERDLLGHAELQGFVIVDEVHFAYVRGRVP
jgi:hypothetical protein